MIVIQPNSRKSHSVGKRKMSMYDQMASDRHPPQSLIRRSATSKAKQLDAPPPCRPWCVYGSVAMPGSCSSNEENQVATIFEVGVDSPGRR